MVKGVPLTSPRLPDAIGIGCRRCATSWLHGVLDQHPQIGKPPNGVHFFSQYRTEGLDWYAEHFQNYLDQKVILDFSVSYTYPKYYSDAAKTVHNMLPNAKIFVALRNPTDRAFSDYLRSIRRLEIPKKIPFEQAIIDYPLLLERGMYSKLLEPFWDRFPKERRLVLIYDDLISDPKNYLVKLWDFLGVKTCLELDLRRKEDKGRSIISANFNRFLLKTKEFTEATLSRLGREKFWDFLQQKYLPFYQKLLALNERPNMIKPSTRNNLLQYYSQDIRKLEQLIQRDLKFWI